MGVQEVGTSSTLIPITTMVTVILITTVII